MLLQTSSVLLLTCCCLVSSSRWMQNPYNDDTFNTRAAYLTNTTLECEDDLGRIIDPFTVKYWILPSVSHIGLGKEKFFLTLDGDAGWKASENGSQLEIINVQEDHFGFYYCVVETADGTAHTIKKALNYKGPHFPNNFENYEKQTIIAFSAAGGFLLLVLALWAIYRYKFPEEEEEVYPLEEEMSQGKPPGAVDYPSQIDGIDNKAAELHDTKL